MAHLNFIKAKREFTERYNHLIEESKVNGEYFTCDPITFNKLVFKPYYELCSIFVEHPDTPISLEIPKTMAFPVNITLPQLFEFLKSLSKDQILHYTSKMQIDMIFKEEIFESIETDDYKLFKDTAKSSREDFEKFAEFFKSLYLIESLKQSELDDIDNENVDDYYQVFKHEILKKLDLCMPNYLKDNEFVYITDYVEKAINQGKSTFPTQEAIGDGVSFDTWLYEEYSYCCYLRFIIECTFISMDPIFYRILWQPFTIGFRLRWSSIFFDLPEDYRIIKNDFFLKKQDSNKEEYINFTTPEFEKAGEIALERFMEICPLKNDADNLNYLTFVYRITGRNRPDVKILPTDILFPESAAYIYSFIEGIRDHKKSEDVYGKIKRFFSTTFFPDNEGDIENPGSDWNNALAELYPNIFCDSQATKTLLKKKRTDDNAPDHRLLKIPAWMSQMTEDEAKSLLAEIGEEFFPGQNFVKLFYYEPATTEPLVWKDEFGALTYFFHVLYAGKVKENKISIESNIPKNETPTWNLIRKRFINSSGNSSSSLGTTSVSKLQDKYAGRIDPRFIPFFSKQKN